MKTQGSSARIESGIRAAVAKSSLAALTADKMLLAASLAFLLNVFLVSAGFFPNLAEINAWDEAAYVNSGRLLLLGELPILSNNPLVALLYALTSLPYVNSPLWLVHSTSVGRVFLFALVWIGAFSVARQQSKFAHPLIMVGILFVSGISVSILVFPSDPLYIGLAALGLAQVLAYINTGSRKHIWLSSLWVGLAALARNDGLILGLLLVPSAFFIARPRRDRWKALLGAAVPFAAIVGGYVLFQGAQTGGVEFGTLGRTYDNFESGHQVIYSAEGMLSSKPNWRRDEYLGLRRRTIIRYFAPSVETQKSTCNE